jgi:predicted helicase
MPSLNLKPTHKAVIAYYDSLARFDELGITHESAVRSAFQELLESCARQFDWKLVPEFRQKVKRGKQVQIDGALLDRFGLNHGFWEAKDSEDDLDKEIKIKFSAGYPSDNILFQAPRRAVLFQQGTKQFDADLTKPDDLVHILTLFIEYAPPAIAEWEKAIEQFQEKVPQLGKSLKDLIENERQTNQKFITAFQGFLSLCRGSLNPNLSVEAVEEMIIQHLLTERIFRKIFDVADFTTRNVIAQEIEKVITALTSHSFDRDSFTKNLNHFYAAIENAAATIHEFSEKQTFLNTVYESFFQGFCVKVADTHGIVYTPQPLVDFMVASVEHVLKKEFGKSLSDQDVHIFDPFTGTGNFVVNLMRRIKRSALPEKYAGELHCNEVMLLPYYVASMNIEHAYYEAMGKYESFQGICLVDTFQTAEIDQGDFHKVLFSVANSARVERQKKAPIKVIIANPPYNAGQINENDNNKNRRYPELDSRVSAFYGEGSKATLRRKLSDPYVKAIRYASDRIAESGIVCFVNNNSFVTEKTFDGMRKALGREFDAIYILDLGGNVRKNPTLSGTTHNVFGIQVGVSINLFIRVPKAKDAERAAKIYYHAVDRGWRKEQKYSFLERRADVDGVKWQKLTPDGKGNWITNGTDEEYESFLPIGSKQAKAGKSVPTIFRTYSLGVSTNRDAVVYDFDAERLARRVEQFAEDYNAEAHRWKTKAKPPTDPKEFANYVDGFVSYEKVKWSETLKRHLAEGHQAEFSKNKICKSLYRPFTEMELYYDPMLVDRPGKFDQFLPNQKAREENKLICLNMTVERPFAALATNAAPNLVAAGGFGCATFAFPLFNYSEDGEHRQDNVAFKARKLFQIFYDDDDISKSDVFHYVYAVLHHPAYTTRFAENLKRELPRIPFVGIAAGGKAASFFPLSAVEKMQGDAKPDHNSKASAKLFHAFAAVGKKLADLHVNYDSAEEFNLQRIENREVKPNWRVETMKVTKDRSAVIYNDFLTLAGIPSEAFDYKLGNRSAIEWVIDQYRVTKDADNHIISDANRLDDEQYIVRLIGQVITVSLETLKLVKVLPPMEE